MKMDKHVSPTYRFRSAQLHGAHQSTLMATRIINVKYFNNIFSSICRPPNWFHTFRRPSKQRI